VDGVKKHETYVRDEFVTVECYPRVTLWGGRDIIKALEKEKDSIDVVHFHLIWFYDKNIIMNALQKLGIRSVITTHGTYSKPHAYTGKRKIVRWLYELDYLRKSTACHILTPEEGTGLMTYGYDGDSFVAPNGFDKEELPRQIRRDFFKDYPFADRIIVSMIAVLRQDKNVDRVIRAISMLPSTLRNQLAFVLIGPDYCGNAAKYQALAQQLGVQDCFYWIGPLYKEDKYNAMYSSDGYIMASDSEGFSMAIIDAMACGLPMMLTSGCNMKYLSDEKFYIMCEPYAQDLNRALQEFLAMDKAERAALGAKAKAVLEEKLYWNKVVEQVMVGYQKVIDKK
jgi:glycosyltransferase involved in cell wall biosynthesis